MALTDGVNAPALFLVTLQGLACELGEPAGADERRVGSRTEELESVISLQELSGEGSLEGFHDDLPTPIHELSNEQQGSSTAALLPPPSGRPIHNAWFSWIEKGLGALSSVLVCAHVASAFQQT